jgi:hypothetical protein
MPHGEVSDIMPASAEAVFDVVHDYARRLEWDTLLRAASIADGSAAAGKGVTTVCVGRRSLGGIALETVYVAFDRPNVAAVKMVNRPPFFRTWAASIRHSPVSESASKISYTYQFTCGPRWLRFAIEPLAGLVFRRETRRRLRALKVYLTNCGMASGSSDGT